MFRSDRRAKHNRQCEPYQELQQQTITRAADPSRSPGRLSRPAREGAGELKTRQMSCGSVSTTLAAPRCTIRASANALGNICSAKKSVVRSFAL